MLNVVTEVALHVHDVFFKKHLFFQLKFVVLFNQMGYYPLFISFLPRTILSRVVTLTSMQAEEKRKKRNL